MRSRSAVLICTPVVLLAAAWLYAGPLNPPAGPITSTHKTLTEVEPRIAINATNTPGDADSLFKITQPGSYYLTGNITGVANKHGIEVAASGVTLDLMGFDLIGVTGMGAFDGVSITVLGLSSVAVVNGSIRNWGDGGVDFGSVSAINTRVENVRASGNAGNGISVGTNGTVTKCSAHQNDGIGITTAFGCTITYCLAHLNTGNGISASSGSTIVSCTSYDNSGSGISVFSGCTVTDCTVRQNTLDGIVCLGASVIRGNTCTTNGNIEGNGAGIHVTGSDCRIEGNLCTTSDRGIDVDNAGNIIIRNTCSGNATNWDIVANNVYGPIIDRSAPASAAVLGNSAASALGSTDPNANFTY